MRSGDFCACPSPALPPNVRVIPPQPFAPSGKGRLARVPQAAPCCHFASLVRSITTQSARLPSESFAFCGAFLANRQIGFGCVRIAIRPFPRRCVGLRGRNPARLALARSGVPGASALATASRVQPVAAPHPPDAGHPASAEYRLRGLSSPRRRGWPSGRPRAARPRVRPRPASPRY